MNLIKRGGFSHTKRAKVKRFLIYSFLFCLMFYIVNAVSYDVVSESHSLAEHEVILRASNYENKNITNSFDFNISGVRKNFDIMNPQIMILKSRLVYDAVKEESKQVVPCPKDSLNGTCYKMITEITGYTPRYEPIWVEIEKQVTIKDYVSLSGVDNMVKSTSELYKFLWINKPNSAGSWELNPEGFFNESWLHRRQFNFTNQTHVHFVWLINLTDFCVGLCKANFSDFRIYNNFTNQEVPYEFLNFTLKHTKGTSNTPYFAQAIIENGSYLYWGYMNNSGAINVDVILFNYTEDFRGGKGDFNTIAYNSNLTSYANDGYGENSLGCLKDNTRATIKYPLGKYTNWFMSEPFVNSNGRTYWLRSVVGDAMIFYTHDNAGCGAGAGYCFLGGDWSLIMTRQKNVWQNFFINWTHGTTYELYQSNQTEGTLPTLKGEHDTNVLNEILNFTIGFDNTNNERFRVDSFRTSDTYFNQYFNPNVPSFLEVEFSGVVVPDMDLLFANSTGTFKTLFQESEGFEGFINLTLSGVPINDSVCTLDFENGIIEREFFNDNFTLCGTGCDFEKVLFNITNLPTTNSIDDQIRVSACIYSLGAKDVTMNTTCTGGIFIEKGNGSQSPQCEDGVTDFVFNVSECVNDENIQIEILNTDGFNLRFQVLGLEYDRTYNPLIRNLTYNFSSDLYENEEVEYYIHGNKTIFGDCVNTDSDLDKNLTEFVTIVNVPPVIFHTLINVSDVGLLSFSDNTQVNVSNVSIVSFFTAVIDDDLINTTHLLECNNGVLLNETHTGQFDVHLLNGTQFIEGNCNFTTFAFDSVGDNDTEITTLDFFKFVPLPIVTFINITDRPILQNEQIGCDFILFDALNVSLVGEVKFFKNLVVQPDFTSNVVTTNNTLTSTDKPINISLVVGDIWACEVIGNNGFVTGNPINTSIVVLSVEPTQNLRQIDLDSTAGVILLFVLVFIWIALLFLSGTGDNIILTLLAGIFGIFVGVVLAQVHMYIMFVMIFLNVVLIFMKFMK